MNVFFVPVAQHHVQVIGGTPINILDQQFSCKLTSMSIVNISKKSFKIKYLLDGSLIHEMNIPRNV